MNETVKKSLLTEDRFMPEMHQKHPGFTYSACRPFTKNKKQIRKFIETEGTHYIYQSELGKVYFQHDIAYSIYKGLAKTNTSDKVLPDKAFASNREYEGY